VSRLVLLPSPLLGPVVWTRVGEHLRERGRDAVVVGLPARVGSPADVLAGFLGSLPGTEPVVLVPHSNAGLYVAALAAERRVEAVLFVDALLPGAAPATPTTSADMRTWLGGLADVDGLLPPWTRWWPEDEVTGLLGDDRTRREVRAGEPRLPLSYFDQTVPSPAGWQRLPAAYLALGDTYAEERAEAVRRGWPVETLAGGHLHPIVDPVATTDALERLLAALERD
jgi:hypothetical protein